MPILPIPKHLEIKVLYKPREQGSRCHNFNSSAPLWNIDSLLQIWEFLPNSFFFKEMIDILVLNKEFLHNQILLIKRHWSLLIMRLLVIIGIVMECLDFSLLVLLECLSHCKNIFQLNILEPDARVIKVTFSVQLKQFVDDKILNLCLKIVSVLIW